MLTTLLRRNIETAPATTGFKSDAVAIGSSPPVDMAVRRRRVFLVLSATLVTTALIGALPGMGAAWWASGLVAVLGVAYLGLLSRVRHLMAAREFDRIGRSADWRWDDWRAALDEAEFQAAAAEVSDNHLAAGDSGEVELGRWALARFAVAYAAAWLLTPVIVVLEQLAGGSRADSRRRRWLAQLLRVRAYGREQAMKGLGLSLAASAGMASLGSMAGVANATPSSGGVAQAVPTTTSTTGPQYTVQRGDDLYRIALRFGTTYQQLAAINHIANPDSIEAGQVISLSASPAQTTTSMHGDGDGDSDDVGTASAVGGSYTVSPGDDLYRIALRFGTTYQQLAAINHIANPDFIEAGQVISVSGPAATTASAVGGTYTVRPGDDLYRIALRFGTTYQQLAAINHIANPGFIEAGQVISVSGPAATTASAQVSQTSARSTSVTPPASFQACVIQRESSGRPNVVNSTGHYGLYQFSFSTWVAAGGSPSLFEHASAAYQTEVFDMAYAKFGVAPWRPYDGC